MHSTKLHAYSLGLLLSVIASVASAQSGFDNRGIILKDEGTTQGSVSILNCVGTTVNCTRSGATGTLTITGGGSSATVVAATLDFGPAGADTATVTVTAQAWVTASSVILCTPTGFATADRGEGSEDAAIEGLTLQVDTRVAGVGFDIVGNPRLNPALGKFSISCIGA